MARDTLTPVAVHTGYPTDGTLLTFVAVVVANGFQMNLSGREVLIAFNSHATLAQTVTITSLADSHNRTGDISADSLAVGEYHFYGPFKLDGWKQSDGNLYFTGSDATIKFAAIRF